MLRQKSEGLLARVCLGRASPCRLGELLKDRFLPETRETILKIIDRMKQHEQIQGVILGGTELPLLLHDDITAGIPLLDTMQIHARAVVAELLMP